MLGLISQMGIAGSGENRVMAEELLHLDQIDAGLDQVSCVAVPQRVWGDLFFRPQVSTTLCRVVCTPPRSSGVVAAAAPFKPTWRWGNNSTGLRCTRQNWRRRCKAARGNGTRRS